MGANVITTVEHYTRVFVGVVYDITRVVIAERNWIKIIIQKTEDVVVNDVVICYNVYKGIGESTCHPNDAFDLEIGTEIAMARAFRDTLGLNTRPKFIGPTTP